MTGLSVESLLKSHSQSPVVVFAVGEPILPTDWSQPRTSVLQRLSDSRVRQFWDEDHMVTDVLKKAHSTGKLHPDCCERNGFFWDLAAAYSPGSEWFESPPLPVLLNGPVVKRTAELEAAIVSPR